MAYELRAEESLRKGLRRIARGQIDNALEQLTGNNARSGGENIHEARKCIKKIRAVLRLVRPAIDDPVYREENQDFRDAGRALSEVRDAKILVEALDKLTEHFAGHVSARSFDSVRDELQARLRAARQHVVNDQQAPTTVAETLHQARERVSDWTDVPNRWLSVGDGLRRTYQQARLAFSQACARRTVADLHEWRKQVKYLRYELRILRPICAEIIDHRTAQTERLGELLGDDHDLAVLRDTLACYATRFADAGMVETLQALIDRRCAELQEQALQLGEEMRTIRPKEFVRPIKDAWSTWREKVPA